MRDDFVREAHTTKLKCYYQLRTLINTKVARKVTTPTNWKIGVQVFNNTKLSPNMY